MRFIRIVIFFLSFFLSYNAYALGDYDDFRACWGTTCKNERFIVYSADEIRQLGASQYCFVGHRTWSEKISENVYIQRGRENAFMLVEDCKKWDNMKKEESWNHPNPALDISEGMDHSKYTYRQWCWNSDAHCTPSQRYLNSIKKEK